jgi:uncharacterized membrane protein YozB (DUF420 family)
MSWYGFIHPVLAIVTMVYGVRVAQTSMSKVLDWDFPLRRQRTRSIVFFILCLVNLGLGFVVGAALRGSEQGVSLTFHKPLAIIVCVLALVAAVLPFTRSRRPGELSGMMKLHHWFIIVPAVIILTMGFTGLLAAFGI